MRAMEHDVRAVLSLGQQHARSLGAATFDVTHVAWALSHRQDPVDQGSPGVRGPGPSSPEMLPFGPELTRLFSGTREPAVTLPELRRLTGA
jgi:hypothetical protein